MSWDGNPSQRRVDVVTRLEELAKSSHLRPRPHLPFRKMYEDRFLEMILEGDYPATTFNGFAAQEYWEEVSRTAHDIVEWMRESNEDWDSFVQGNSVLECIDCCAILVVQGGPEAVMHFSQNDYFWEEVPPLADPETDPDEYEHEVRYAAAMAMEADVTECVFVLWHRLCPVERNMTRLHCERIHASWRRDYWR